LSLWSIVHRLLRICIYLINIGIRL
jgi:hypothetical protein